MARTATKSSATVGTTNKTETRTFRLRIHKGIQYKSDYIRVESHQLIGHRKSLVVLLDARGIGLEMRARVRYGRDARPSAALIALNVCLFDYGF
jgi:hypothetical protein